MITAPRASDRKSIDQSEPRARAFVIADSCDAYVPVIDAAVDVSTTN
jgi:hypothetical protein